MEGGHTRWSLHRALFGESENPSEGRVSGCRGSLSAQEQQRMGLFPRHDRRRAHPTHAAVGKRHAGQIIVPLPRVDSPRKVGHFPRMSTITEIEEALPELSAEELRRVETVIRRLQSRLVEAASTAGNPRLRALDALQSRLALDSDKADAWVAVVQEARR